MPLMEKYINTLNGLDFSGMYNNDFFLTWEKTRGELDAVFTVAAAHAARKQRLFTYLRQRARDLALPRQLDAHPFFLRLGLQPSRP